MSSCDTFWEDQLATAKELVAAYNAAILALATGAQQYTLTTGQSTQQVTQANLASLRIARDGLLNEVATLEARVYGCGAARVVPSW